MAIDIDRALVLSEQLVDTEQRLDEED